MICMVLAAGYATRLYPLTKNFPKPLLDVGGKPILNWLLDDIDQLENCGGFHDSFEHFVVAAAAFLIPFFPLAHCLCTSFCVIFRLIS